MADIDKKKLCENCFTEIEKEPCPVCGFSREKYRRDPMALGVGSVLEGRYAIGRVIGKGGFGVTYLAYDRKLECKVAVKEYYPYGLAARDPGSTHVSVSSAEAEGTFKSGAEKFYDEARLVAKFNGNPNIVSVHDFFYENDTVYFTMGYLDGMTLKSYLKEYGVLSPGQAVSVAQAVSNALMAAHSLNVLHRDISPDNIMVCKDGAIKLLDFGAARQVVTEGSQSLSVILKQGFAPLEQYQKKGKQGPWTDIYSLGATLYHALTLDTLDDPMSRLEEDEEYNSNKHHITEELWGIIQKATALRMQDRYQDIFEFKKDLNEISVKEEPLNVPKVTAEKAGFGMAAERIDNAGRDIGAGSGDDSSAAEDAVGVTKPLQEEDPVGMTKPLEEEDPVGMTRPLEEEETAGAARPLQEETADVSMPQQEDDSAKAEISEQDGRGEQEKEEKQKRKDNKKKTVIGFAAIALAALVILFLVKKEPDGEKVQTSVPEKGTMALEDSDTAGEDASEGRDNLEVIRKDNTGESEDSDESSAVSDTADIPESSESNPAVTEEGVSGTTSEGFEYTLYGNYAEINGYEGNESALVIPAEIENVPVMKIGDKAFKECSNLTSIEIPEGVTEIGAEAFHKCTGLTDVEIPKSMTKIGRSAFEACFNLANIEIPKGVTEIMDSAFSFCKSLASIEIPEGVTIIIGSSAFRDCSSLTSITIPEGVTEIGFEAFRGCSSLTSIEIPDSVTEIGKQVFVGCSSLVKAIIPGGRPFPMSLFRDYDNLEVIRRDSTDGNSASGVTPTEDFEYTVYDDYVEINGYKGNDTFLVIPAEMEHMPVTKIGSSAFEQSLNLTGVEIPEGVTEIDACAFRSCYSLVSINIPESVAEIGWWAFDGCENLTSIEIPEHTKIDAEAFKDCSFLTITRY